MSDAKQRPTPCEACGGTGFYGDNGPGICGNGEWVRCECGTAVKCTIGWHRIEDVSGVAWCRECNCEADLTVCRTNLVIPAMPNPNRPTPETDANECELEFPTLKLEWVVDSDFSRRLERQRDEARQMANTWHTRAEAHRQAAEFAASRAERAESALAELRSLWACDEDERQRAVETWRTATGCKDGTPSVGAMLAFFRHECEVIRANRDDFARNHGLALLRIDGLTRERDQARDALRRLHNAAEVYSADQSYAPHPHIAAVQPVEPADGVALNEALAEAARVLGIEADSPMWPASRSASACANPTVDPRPNNSITGGEAVQ